MQSKLQNWLIELVFPARCVLCGQYECPNYICRTCLRAIPLSGKFGCIGCERPTPAGLTCPVCQQDYFIDQLISITQYREPKIQKIIEHYKYKFIDRLHKPLSQLVIRRLKSLAKNKKNISIFKYWGIGDSLIIMPVPLHQKRKRFRGFNQAELIARSLANHFMFEYQPDLLIRKHTSLPQVKVNDRKIRLKNVHGLFACSYPDNVKDRNILLIDDVCTTGATLNECAKVLKQSGASKVSALVIARG